MQCEWCLHSCEFTAPNTKLGERNASGDRLVDFCSAYDPYVASTWFPRRMARKVTWVSPSGLMENAIDHVLVSRTDSSP